MKARRVRLIMWKELLQLRRDRLLLPLVFIMPIMYVIMFGYVVGSDVRNLPTAIVDGDRTVASRQLIDAFSSSGYFVVTQRPSSETSLQPLIDQGRVKVAIVIQRGTAAALERGETVPLGIIVDGADSKTASVASGYAAEIVAAFDQRLLEAAGRATGGPRIDARVRVMFNPSLKSVNAMVPGLVCSILMLSIMVIMSQAVVRERARGTLEQMMVTPITRAEYLTGKVLPYVAIATVQMTFIVLIGRYWFGVPFNGSVWTVALGLVLFTFTSIGMGLLISLVSKTQQQAQQTVMFVMIPTMVLSGFIFPIESMPAAIVPVTYLIPLRYALVVLRGAFLKGSGILDLWAPLAAMVVFGVVIFGLAVSRFQKRLAE
jgi:ABC-type multidrug transport system permease subunit